MTSMEQIQEAAIKQLATVLKESSFAQFEDAHEPDFRVDGAIPTSTCVVITVTDFNRYGVREGEDVFRIRVEVERL